MKQEVTSSAEREMRHEVKRWKARSRLDGEGEAGPFEIYCRTRAARSALLGFAVMNLKSNWSV